MKELLINYVTGETIEGKQYDIQEIVSNLLQDYIEEQNKNIILGRDNFFNRNVWFIYEVNKNYISRLQLKNEVKRYIMKGDVEND